MHSHASSLGVIARQFASFAGLGALATAAHYAILIALVQLAGLGATSASSLGFGISAVGNYALNRRFTFRSRAPHTLALPKFAVVAIIGLALNALVLSTLTALGAHYLVAQVAATGIVLCWNFLVNRRWTFNAGGGNPQQPKPAADQQPVQH